MSTKIYIKFLSPFFVRIVESAENAEDVAFSVMLLKVVGTRRVPSTSSKTHNELCLVNARLAFVGCDISIAPRLMQILLGMITIIPVRLGNTSYLFGINFQIIQNIEYS